MTREAALGLGSGIQSGYATLGGRSGGDYDSVGYNYRNTATSGSYLYNAADTSSRLEFTAGGFKFKTAGSGSAGNPITYTDAMTILQSSGNVGIGATNPGSRLQVDGAQTGLTPEEVIIWGRGGSSLQGALMHSVTSANDLGIAVKIGAPLHFLTGGTAPSNRC